MVENCDIEADDFLSLLGETGVGVLEHPMYGPRDVVPYGEITRTDRVKTAANQSQVSVSFWETTNIIYPNTQSDPASLAEQAISDVASVSAVNFNSIVSLDSAVERVNFQNGFSSILEMFDGFLAPVVNAEDQVRRRFQAISDSINNGIDVLIANPLTLATQVNQLIREPSRLSSNIVARLSAYGDLVTSIISGDGASVDIRNDNVSLNQFHLNDLVAISALSGQMSSAINANFETRQQALASAITIIDQFNEVILWRDSIFESFEGMDVNLSLIDNGHSYQMLQNAVATTAGSLVEISFALRQERRLRLQRNRTIVDLTAELYGEVDNRLDFFINSNRLTGSEILELPRGREIVYYI